MDMALDHTQLQNMDKNKKEAFKEYAQRWTELFARIQPPLSEKKMPPFYEKMVGCVSSNFLDLVIIGKRVEVGMRKGKIVLEVVTSRADKSPNKRKEGETNMVASTPNHYQLPTRQSHAVNGQRGRNNPARGFAPILMSYVELLAHLPKNYDPTAKCDYHASTIGHTTEKYLGLKYKVQDLMDTRLLSFKEKGLSMRNNPLPHHGSTS
ncbi:hypothetical protein CR513_26571, partial [Mucuna pruriens]